MGLPAHVRVATPPDLLAILSNIQSLKRRSQSAAHAALGRPTARQQSTMGGDRTSGRGVGRGGGGDNDNRKANITCHNCGGTGHYAAECPSEPRGGNASRAGQSGGRGRGKEAAGERQGTRRGKGGKDKGGRERQPDGRSRVMALTSLSAESALPAQSALPAEPALPVESALACSPEPPATAASKSIIDTPPFGLSSSFLVDSGAALHGTYDKSELHQYRALSNGPTFAYGNGSVLRASGVGKIYLLDITARTHSVATISDVYYVPGSKVKLLSVSTLTKKGASIHFGLNDNTLSVGDSTLELRCHSGVYSPKARVVPPTVLTPQERAAVRAYCAQLKSITDGNDNSNSSALPTCSPVSPSVEPRPQAASEPAPQPAPVCAAVALLVSSGSRVKSPRVSSGSQVKSHPDSSSSAVKSPVPRLAGAQLCSPFAKTVLRAAEALPCSPHVEMKSAPPAPCAAAASTPSAPLDLPCLLASDSESDSDGSDCDSDDCDTPLVPHFVVTRSQAKAPPPPPVESPLKSKVVTRSQAKAPPPSSADPLSKFKPQGSPKPSAPVGAKSEFFPSLGPPPVMPSPPVGAPAVSPSAEAAALLHRRLGHLGLRNLRRMVHKSLALGIDSAVTPTAVDKFAANRCDVCAQSKSTKRPAPSSGHRGSAPLDLVHMDLMGPFTKIPTIHDELYVLTMYDDCSGFSSVRLLTAKNKAPSAAQALIEKAENQLGTRVKRVRTDRGTEVLNTAMSTWYASKGIDHSPSAGVDATPHELFFGTKPDISMLRVFGSPVYPYLPKKQRPHKFSPAASLGYLVGYGNGGSEYLVFTPAPHGKGTVTSHWSVTFNETAVGTYHGPPSPSFLLAPDGDFNDGDDDEDDDGTGPALRAAGMAVLMARAAASALPSPDPGSLEEAIKLPDADQWR
ncbi:hypothetical protein HYH03_018883 [Edaphochlamys debaryana]|uniref:CCHC-type domain-containing protein n=1 Tax=Edaphochlamys debaryana TaxID=47281 RepID=A0A836BNX3_9CHLO|nr:hypothetical protein HYH03_018883 [Edaphochlamys debaryana]|eukprot:KAG2482169.1 hypothetical protein HYH03_018883 [Edaphochlamys debaryana]